MARPELLREWARERGLIVRAPSDEEFSQMKEIARASFPVPVGWVDRPEQAARYRPDFCRTTEYGTMKATVAVGVDGFLRGYCFYQLRLDGEAYLQEIAATPPPSRTKVRQAGTLLLAAAVADGLAASGYRKLTANVWYVYRATFAPLFVQRDWNDPVPFYRRFGFTRYERFGGGYRSDSPHRDPRDTWLEAPIELVWEAIVRYLDVRTEQQCD
jgi:hypothetical protein